MPQMAVEAEMSRFPNSAVTASFRRDDEKGDKIHMCQLKNLEIFA
jgi:hypothetical protein